MLIQSYVGVTGFMHSREIRDVLSHDVRSALHGARQQLMVGVLANQKTIGGLVQEGKRRWRYPSSTEVQWIFSQDAMTLNLVHFTTRAADLHLEMLDIAAMVGPHFNGFQLNIVWPNREQLILWRLQLERLRCPPPRLVIAINRAMVDSCHKQPATLASMLAARYKEVATDFLLDLSGGAAVAIDLEESTPYLEALYQRFGDTHGISIAGSLGADAASAEKVGALRRMYPHISIDAEGALRTVIDAQTGEDRLDTAKARQYLLGALQPVL